MDPRWLWIALPAWVVLGCGGAPDPPPDPAAVEVPRELSWSPVSGSDEYQVQAWSGARLLFEAATRDTILPLTVGMTRAVAAFDSVRVEVRALDRDGAVVAAEQRSIFR